MAATLGKLGLSCKAKKFSSATPRELDVLPTHKVWPMELLRNTRHPRMKLIESRDSPQQRQEHMQVVRCRPSRVLTGYVA